MVKNSSTTFVNARDSRSAPREQRPRSTSSNAYTRNPSQVGFGSDQGIIFNFIYFVLLYLELKKLIFFSK